MVKEFLEKYGKKIGEGEIALVQQLANDVPREKMAQDLGIEYKALAARISKVRESVEVDSDSALIAFFLRNGLIE